MARLEDLTRGAQVRGLHPDGPATIVDVQWHGSTCVELTYKDAAGRPHSELIFRDREPTLEVVTAGQAWSFDADGGLLRLVSEAYRIRLAHLFDPLLAVHTSILEPFPHQIRAVYGEMLPRQPLRFLLADDPGAGKTIMAGLFVKELRMRGDVHRCLIVCPGNLVEQWQDEMRDRFQLDFEPVTRQRLEEVPDAFHRYPMVLCRLDQLSRNEEIQAKLRDERLDWDLVIVDEAHKMSAHFFGGEVKETRRYKLGKLLGELTRHFLLLTATPHNGKEEDFQLFMVLLDADRFEGRFRDGVHVVDPSDLIRRLVKEQLLKFDGTPIFPERWAYTVNYKLSDLEAQLYREVTEYVREGMNRAERLAQEGEGRRGNLVGWALTILQRRLASSPQAIAESLRRRRERLERRLREEQLLRRGAEVAVDTTPGLEDLAPEGLVDLDDAPAEEVEVAEEEIVEQASAARTIAELASEITALRKLEDLAQRVRRSGTDRKWEELSNLLQTRAEMFDAGHRRKLVVFTEHRDTLSYLADKIRALLGRAEVVVTIHGTMRREERRKAQQFFTQEKHVQILVATDAAGEGINLQRAHLMVNYDLPWNPNRIEQRFGRIHRIGQTEVCHLWNLVAAETREGEVYHRLLEKLRQEREALGGQVFDVLGKLFQERSLRDLLIEAIRYGDQPEVQARLFQVVENAAARKHIQELLEERALVRDALDVSQVRKIREDLERAEARRLQPHFIRAFFLEAFRHLGGTVREREPKRYEITHVPAPVRTRDRQIGRGDVVLSRYERICFEKDQINVPGKPLGEFVCPGHPLLDAAIDLVLERYRHLLRQGAVLIDPTDPGEELRALLYLEHEIQDARTDRHGNRRVISKRLQFVEMTRTGVIRSAGYAPYLDYRSPDEGERALLKAALVDAWARTDLEAQATSYAIQHLVPEHFQEVRERKEELAQKAMAAVKDRLTKEINYWDHRANVLKDEELAGRVNAKINSAKARRRADELQARLEQRMGELEQERKLSPKPPVVVGGALIVPAGVLERIKGERDHAPPTFAKDRDQIEALAMAAVLDTERRLGRDPQDVHKEKRGYDIESSIPGTGRLLFIEVKGRAPDARTVTITKNEILTCLNKPDEFILAVVGVEGDVARTPRYVRQPFQREPDFGVTSVNYNLDELLARGADPA
ncbi:MAG: helicase-related protein [Candidatus Methylomirabilales bacterium]